MTRRNSLVVILFAVLAFIAACAHRSDDAITTDIKARMFSEPSLKSASVNISAKDGIVTLTGTVADDSARLAAQRIASQTKGVKQVIDSTTVAAPAPVMAENTPPPAAPEPVPQTAPTKPSTASKTPIKSPSAAPPIPVSAPPAPASAAEPGPVSTTSTPPTPTPPPTPPPPPQPITLTIPDGTIITVRTVDSIDSATNTTGQYFKASLDNAVVVDDHVVLPKGLNAKLKLVEASSAGKFKGTSELTVSLESIAYQGKTYVLSTSDVQEKGGSRGKRSAAVIGGGAALGALIGGLAGGGKGAAIGAGVGAGGGTAVQALTKGQQVKIPSETRLDFTLHAPVDVTYIPGKKPSHRPPASTDQTQPAPDQTQPQ